MLYLIPLIGQQTPFFLVEGCIKGTIPKAFCGIISWTEQIFLNPARNATFFYLKLKFNPLDAEGFEWYFEALKIAQNLTEKTGISAILSLPPPFLNRSCLAWLVVAELCLLLSSSRLCLLVFLTLSTVPWKTGKLFVVGLVS